MTKTIFCSTSDNNNILPPILMKMSTNQQNLGSTTTSSQPINMSSIHFYGPSLPIPQDVVFVEVSQDNQLEKDGIYVDDAIPFLFVRLLEFGGLLGTITSEEFSLKRKKSKSPFQGIRIGKRFAAIVTKIDTKQDTHRTFIDLSKKDLRDSTFRHQAQIKFDKAEKLNRIFEQVCEMCTNLSLPELMKSIAWPLYQQATPSNHPLDTVLTFAQRQDVSTLLLLCPLCSSDTAKTLFQACTKLSQAPPAAIIPISPTRVLMPDSVKHVSFDEGVHQIPPVTFEVDDVDSDTTDTHLDELHGMVHDLLKYSEEQLANFEMKELLDSARVELVVFRGTNNYSNTDVLHALLSYILQFAIDTAIDTAIDIDTTSSTNNPHSMLSLNIKHTDVLRLIRTSLERWGSLIKTFSDDKPVRLCNFSVPQGQLELVFWLVEFCARDLAGEPGGTAELLGFGSEELFSGVLCALYNENIDLLDEEAILGWAEYCTQHYSSRDPEHALLARCARLVHCLQQED